jgi:hypothetical protein
MKIAVVNLMNVFICFHDRASSVYGVGLRICQRVGNTLNKNNFVENCQSGCRSKRPVPDKQMLAIGFQDDTASNSAQIDQIAGKHHPCA